MNSVVLIGRLTRDPEIRYTSGTQMAVATFTVAIDRPVRAGGEKQTDFPRITVQGRIQTGSYQNKDGVTVYTTDVVADRVEFLEWGDRPSGGSSAPRQNASSNYGGGNAGASAPRGNDMPEEMPDSFQAIDEDVPF